MQLQIYIILQKLGHKMSYKSSFSLTRFEFRWKMIPESRSRGDLLPQIRFEVGLFRSDMMLERKLRGGV